MLGLSIRKFPIWEIRWHQRQIIAAYNHWIYEFDAINSTIEGKRYSLEKISIDNIGECDVQNNFSTRRMCKYLRNCPDKCEGFLAHDSADGKVAGFLWVMYKYGNEYQYKVRKCDAFIFDVWVAEEMRGKGVCGSMINNLLYYLQKKGLSKVRLGVRKNNISAIRAYEKAGGKRLMQKFFIIIARRIKIPYYKI